MYGNINKIMNNTQKNIKELVRKSLMQEADIEVTADRYGEEKALGQAAMMLDVLEDKLKKHDWFYMMSDDNRKYKEGTTQQIEIRKIIKQLEDIGYGADAKKLFNQYAPDGPGGSTLKIKEGKKEFPDLTGDGKVTKADILKGRGVKLKEEYTEEVDTLALTIKDPNEFEKAKQHFESNSDFYPFDINDEFKTFYFQVQDQADADSTEFYLTQELEGETDLQGYYFSIETSPLSEDLDLGHEDNEPHMLKGDLYRIGKYAMELYQMIDGFEGKGEVDFPHWWQSKIVKAKDILISAKHYLDFELKEPEIDVMVGVASDEEVIDDVPMMENVKFTIPELSQLKPGDKVKYLGKDKNGFKNGEKYEVSRKESSSTFQPTITIKNDKGQKLRTSNLSKINEIKEVKSIYDYNDEVKALALTIKDPNEFEKAKQHFESNSDFYPFDINDEFKTFYFQIDNQDDEDNTEYYLNQELENDTDLKGYYFSTESSPLSEGIHDRNITSASHTNIKTPPKGVGDYNPRERAANLAALKNFGPKDKEIKEDEIGKADILSGELYKLKGKIQDAYFAKIRKFINMGSYEDAEYLLNRVKGQMNEKGLAETIAKKLKSK